MISGTVDLLFNNITMPNAYSRSIDDVKHPYTSDGNYNKRVFGKQHTEKTRYESELAYGKTPQGVCGLYQMIFVILYKYHMDLLVESDDSAIKYQKWSRVFKEVYRPLPSKELDTDLLVNSGQFYNLLSFTNETNFDDMVLFPLGNKFDFMVVMKDVLTEEQK